MGRSVDWPRPAYRDALMMFGWFAAISVAYLTAMRIAGGQIGLPTDDAYIHLQFARNLVEDGQMAFNRGVRSSGSTAPLYPVLLAGVYMLVRNWFAASYMLGALCGFGTPLAVYGILRSWTGRQDLARWGGILTVMTTPTVIQAYGGMESPVYTLLFLAGLWLYSARDRRVSASVVFGLCIWLRPEFVMLLPLICLERAVAAWRLKERRCLGFIEDMWPHGVVWSLMVLAYVGYNWHQDRHLVPSTFAAKAVVGSVGLPSALRRGELRPILMAIGVWPLFAFFVASIGIGVNCAPLAFGGREAAVACWRDDGPAAAGRRLALIVLLGYPLLRGLIEPMGVFFFHFQRYYAHLTPLIILLVIGSLPATGVVLARPFWSWRGVPLRSQQRRTILWACPCLIVTGILMVVSVSNITSMQVRIGQWVRNHTLQDQLVATNDIGAIGFVSGRPLLDTVGLVEPNLIGHLLSGGKLLDYLKHRNPAYVVIFPGWYPDLAARKDLLEPVHSVRLRWNLICGGPEMVVYRPKWKTADVPSGQPRRKG
jgi:hypothetical protein